jgi:type II secretory pathway component PulF
VVLVFASILMSVFFATLLPAWRDMHRNYDLEPTVGPLSFLAAFGAAGIPLAVVVGLVAAVAALSLWGRRTVAGERFLHRLPGLGRILRNLSVARFLGALGVLLRARTPLADALPVAMGASGSVEMVRVVERLRSRAAEGAGLAEVLRAAPVVPVAVTGYLAVAEKSNQAARASEELAEMLTEQAVEDSGALFTVLLPSALLATGVLLGTLFVSLVSSYAKFLERLAG